MEKAPEPNTLPLWGIPFAVKDNIDVVGLPTTAACPAFAYQPDKDATVVARLKAAGAIVIGKTNLDQFATGLNGTRSPYGAPRSVFNKDYVSGGSSSGSAVAVGADWPVLHWERIRQALAVYRLRLIIWLYQADTGVGAKCRRRSRLPQCGCGDCICRDGG